MASLVPYAASAAAVGLAIVLLRRRRAESELNACPACCPDGALPFLPTCDYASKGTHDVAIGQGMAAYVTATGSAESWAEKPVLVLVSDIFGHRSGRHSQIADFWADSTGGIAVAPDFFGGEPLATPASGFVGLSLITSMLWALISGKFKPWTRRVAGAVEPNLAILCDFLKAKGVTRFAIVGFCWGAYPVLKASASPLRAAPDASPRLAAAVHFHPSAAKICEIMGEDSVELARQAAALGVPQLVRSTSMEPASWQPGGAVHMALKEKLVEGNCDFGTIGAQHGFMVRATMKSAAERSAVREGLDALVSFCAPRLQ